MEARLALGRVNVDYDEEADDSIEVEEGVVYRLKGVEVVGITVVGLKKRLKRPERF